MSFVVVISVCFNCPTLTYSSSFFCIFFGVLGLRVHQKIGLEWVVMMGPLFGVGARDGWLTFSLSFFWSLIAVVAIVCVIHLENTYFVQCAKMVSHLTILSECAWNCCVYFTKKSIFKKSIRPPTNFQMSTTWHDNPAGWRFPSIYIPLFKLKGGDFVSRWVRSTPPLIIRK
jgi:hypothetical protein